MGGWGKLTCHNQLRGFDQSDYLRKYHQDIVDSKADWSKNNWVVQSVNKPEEVGSFHIDRCNFRSNCFHLNSCNNFHLCKCRSMRSNWNSSLCRKTSAEQCCWSGNYSKLEPLFCKGIQLYNLHSSCLNSLTTPDTHRSTHCMLAGVNRSDF